MKESYAQVRPLGAGTAYVLLSRGSRTYVERVTGTGSVSIPISSGAPTAIAGFGSELFALTSSGLLRYRHDPADVFP